MILHPAKTEIMLLATRQKHQLRPFQLNLSTLLAQLNTLWTPKRKLFYRAHISPHLTYMHQLSGTAVVISYLTN